MASSCDLLSMSHSHEGGSTRSLGSSVHSTRRIALKKSGSSHSLGSRSSRQRRVKRTIQRQRRRREEQQSGGFSFTNALVSSLADVAQAFLYPEESTSKAVNSSTETMEMSDDYTNDSLDTDSTGRSLDTPTPPPTLAKSSSFDPNAVKRPIPVSSPGSSFDPVFPSSFGAETPIARMRAPRSAENEQQERAPPVLSVDEQSRYSEHLMADKHRKWRRQIKMQKKRLQKHQDDDTSLLTTCGPLAERSGSKHHGSRGQAPVDILAQLMRAPCAQVGDVESEWDERAASSYDDDDEKDNSLIDDTDDEESTNYGSSVTGGESEADDRQSDFTGSERQSDFTSERQSDFTSERQSDFTSERQSDFTSERQSDFTGESGYTDASSVSRQLSSPKTVSSCSGSTRTGSSIRGVLKTSSFGSTSSAMHAAAEQARNKDKNFIKAFIEELTNDGMLLIWHGPEGDSTAFRRPCGVVANLKLGSPADGVYGGPRLEWQKQDGSDGGALDLFEIQSMDTASFDMLEPYKFAIPDNTFFVTLNSGKHVVFEAGSDTEARRFIHGLRWVVARLSFNLVVGNPLVSCELLSVKGKTSASPQTPLEETLWSKAMNDVTNHLVDTSLMQEI